MMFSLIKNRAFQVVVLVMLYLFTASNIPMEMHRLFYTISIFIKDCLMVAMPLVVCFFIAHTIKSFDRYYAPLFIILLVVFETLSNLTSVWYAYLAAHSVDQFIPELKVQMSDHSFTYLWKVNFGLPKWWSASWGAFAGLILGCAGTFVSNLLFSKFINDGRAIMEFILSKIFANLIPFFVLGFIAQSYNTKMLTNFIEHYSILLLILLLLLAVYLALLFAMGAGFRIRNFLKNLSHLLPAAGIALTSGCSLSTMPWTISGVQKIIVDRDLAKAVIPATTNIQQIGDAIANSFLCFLLYSNFYHQAPNLIMWLHFSCVFALARFATAAMLGGAIFVMIPIYEQYLNFTQEMIAMIVAFNVILDPIITSANVAANGALCVIFEKLWGGLKYKCFRKK